MHHLKILLLSFAIANSSAWAQKTEEKAAPAPAVAKTFNWTPFQTLLTQFLQETNLPGGGYETAFDYEAALKDKTTRALISQQLKELEGFDRKTLTDANTAKAFWINAYNFLMIAKIFKSGTEGQKLKIDGVKDMGSFFNPYKAFKTKDFNVGGQKMTLDEIEKGTLLGKEYKKKGWKDARIHFAVNCASVGCPPLLKVLYTKDTVDQLLDENTRKAMKGARHLKFEDGKLYGTELFKWYKDDFKEDKGSVVQFIAHFVDDEALKKKILAQKKVLDIKYDWSLNKPANFKKKK